MNQRGRVFAKAATAVSLPVPKFLGPFLRCAYRTGVFCVEVCILIRKLFWTEPLLRAIASSVGCKLRVERLPYIRGNGKLIIGDEVTLSGRSCFYFMRMGGVEPRITLGSRVFVGHGCTFSSGRSITVGNDVLIAAGVRIHDNDGHPLDPERRLRGEKISLEETAEVVIENGAWIGAQAIILKGVRVGQNSIVGAGAVVTSDVPADTIVAGNPARAVKHLSGG